MNQVKIVIGANYGDEGKGMMTDYFAANAAAEGRRVIAVCHNGGPQRGHTVEYPDGRRHIFHHFASGALAGADTYLADTFLINPVFYLKEVRELSELNGNTRCFLHPDAPVILPYDLLLNQCAEEQRAGGRHGSCGMGIYEAVRRSRSEDYRMSAERWLSMNASARIGFLERVRSDYVDGRLKELSIDRLPNQYREILESPFLIENFIQDMEEMLSEVRLRDTKLLTEYDTVIFEGGQGLLLDQNRTEGMPHLTPSNTGLANPAMILKELRKTETFMTEVCYVTRTYLTRHGAGTLFGECKKEEINEWMEDRTNVPNPYQEKLRYGWMEAEALKKRILRDYQDSAVFAGVSERDCLLSLAVTHRNETNGFFAGADGNFEICAGYASRIYSSDSCCGNVMLN